MKVENKPLLIASIALLVVILWFANSINNTFGTIFQVSEMTGALVFLIAIFIFSVYASFKK